jgi:hypothetical protein
VVVKLSAAQTASPLFSPVAKEVMGNDVEGVFESQLKVRKAGSV